jgi:hypothetical protein
MPELLVLARFLPQVVPDDGCFAAAAAHNVVVSRTFRTDPRRRWSDLIGRTSGYAVGNWIQSHADPIRLIASLAARCGAGGCDLVLAAVSAACLLPISRPLIGPTPEIGLYRSANTKPALADATTETTQIGTCISRPCTWPGLATAISPS